MTPVLFHFLTPTGDPIVDTPFNIQLERSDTDEAESGVILPRMVYATTDFEGKATVNLAPTTQRYHVTLVDNDDMAALHFDFYVPVSVTPVRLQDIMINAPVSTVPYDEAALLAILNTKIEVFTARDATFVARDIALANNAAVAGAVVATAASQTAAAASAAASQVSNLASGVSAGASSTSATASAGSAVTAAARAADALTYLNSATTQAGLAAGSATAASTSAGTATTQATASATSAAAALASQGVATTQATASATSATASETSRVASVAAKVASEAARDASIVAKDIAVTKAAEASTSATDAANTVVNRLRIDVNNQGLTAPEKLNGLTNLGIQLINNTSDASKPVSTATQTALDLKANLAGPTFTGTVSGISKTMVGLSNVDNTTDAAKPVSTATQTALNLKANLASPTLSGILTIGAASGLQQMFISGGGYDLLMGASGGAIFGYATQAISIMINTTAVPLGIGTNGAQPLIFGTSNFERARVSSGGNLLLGTTTDDGTNKLQVVGSTVVTKTATGATTEVLSLKNAGTGASTRAEVGFYAAGTKYAGITGGYSAAAPELAVLVSATSIARFTSSGLSVTGALTVTDAMQRTGTAGAGSLLFTATGSTTAHVYGHMSNTGGVILMGLEQSTGSALFTGGLAYAGAIGTVSNTSMQFASNGLIRMTVSAAGNTLIGTTTDDGSNKLQVNGSATIGGALAVTGALTVTATGNYGTFNGGATNSYHTYLAAAATYGYIGQGSAVVTGGPADGLGVRSQTHLVFASGGATERMRVSSAGNLLIGTATDDGVNKLQVTGAIKATGLVTATVGAFNGTGSPSSGAAVEIGYTGGIGYVQSYSRTAGAYTTMNMYGSAINFGTGTSGTERMQIDAAGNILIGSTGSTWSGVSGRGLIELNGTVNTLFGFRIAGAAAGYLYHDATDLILFNQKVGGLKFYANSALAMTVNSSGYLLVGAATSSGFGDVNRICRSAAQGSFVLSIDGGTEYSAAFKSVTGAGSNTAESAMYVGKNSTTSRSINAGGTVNASGADYAEYMTKAEDCGVILKGQIVGVDVDGKLTDKWDDAVSFVVKSTDPSYVGGDNWGAELNEEELEIARAKVDRIAYAGQVPVNVMNAVPGQYIVPNALLNTIVGEVVNAADMTMAQYLRAVGIVQNILPDGRANIRVKVA